MIDVQLKIFDLCLGDSIVLFELVIVGSVGMDLCVVIEVLIMFVFGVIVLVFSGFVIYIGDLGWCVLIVLCLGLGYKQGLVMGNLVGVIDVDYQGLLMILCWNCGNVDVMIGVGDCIV